MRVFLILVFIFSIIFTDSFAKGPRKSNRVRNPNNPERSTSLYSGRGKKKSFLNNKKRSSYNERLAKRLKRYSARERRRGVNHTVW
ncbi:MAG: hypothetical protein Q8880_13470 [Bacteroidota bacterium]|nr:hypothetical protein [Bacteroidota bacterium]